MYRVNITIRAEEDIAEAFAWWRDNRSAAQAARWLDNVYPAIETLSQFPARCPQCSDGEDEIVCRQLLFGVGRRNTHRIVFAIDGDKVTVLRVRHVARSAG